MLILLLSCQRSIYLKHHLSKTKGHSAALHGKRGLNPYVAHSKPKALNATEQGQPTGRCTRSPEQKVNHFSQEKQFHFIVWNFGWGISCSERIPDNRKFCHKDIGTWSSSASSAIHDYPVMCQYLISRSMLIASSVLVWLQSGVGLESPLCFVHAWWNFAASRGYNSPDSKTCFIARTALRFSTQGLLLSAKGSSEYEELSHGLYSTSDLAMQPFWNSFRFAAPTEWWVPCHGPLWSNFLTFNPTLSLLPWRIFVTENS